MSLLPISEISFGIQSTLEVDASYIELIGEIRVFLKNNFEEIPCSEEHLNQYAHKVSIWLIEEHRKELQRTLMFFEKIDSQTDFYVLL